MRIRLVLLGVKRRPAAAGRCVAAIAAAMDAERQIQFLGLFIDWPVAMAAERLVGAGGGIYLPMAAERLVGARRDIDLHIAAGFRTTFDFGDGGCGVVLPDQDRGFQPRIAVA